MHVPSAGSDSRGVLQVAWPQQCRQLSSKQKQIVTEIKRIHTLPRHRGLWQSSYPPRARQAGRPCSLNTVAKLMKANGIQARNQSEVPNLDD